MSDEAKDFMNAKKVECDRQTDRPTDGQVKRGIVFKVLGLKGSLSLMQFLSIVFH